MYRSNTLPEAAAFRFALRATSHPYNLNQTFNHNHNLNCRLWGREVHIEGLMVNG